MADRSPWIFLLGIFVALFLLTTACKRKKIEAPAAPEQIEPVAEKAALPPGPDSQENPVVDTYESPQLDVTTSKAPDIQPTNKPKTTGLVAPARYEKIVGRVRAGNPRRFSNLLLEGNNAAMRGRQKGEDGPFEYEGTKVASKWKEAVNGVRGVFVLRDSLYSQQDHPYRHASHAIMLPPNWVTVAAQLASEKKEIHAPRLPPIDDDAGWAKRSPAQIFGSFPVSESLFRRAVIKEGTEPDEWTQVFARNARNTLHRLIDQARALKAAAGQGPKQVANVGAELIARSDVQYFGEHLRRCCVIPIFVENPNKKEVGEGKGIQSPTGAITEDIAELVMSRIYKRRLRDGDLAIERYDLSNAKDRNRAIKVLEAILPKGEREPASRVWLWVNGKLDPKKKLQGEGPLQYMPTFREEIAKAKIESSRLEFLAKPTIFVRGSDDERRAIIEKNLPRFQGAGVMMSVSSPAPSLVPLLSR